MPLSHEMGIDPFLKSTGSTQSTQDTGQYRGLFVKDSEPLGQVRDFVPLLDRDNIEAV
jgi:hypothetical protein